jgi:hypothetical protein
MKHYSTTGRRKHGRSLKRLLDTWDRNGSTSGPSPSQIYDDEEAEPLAPLPRIKIKSNFSVMNSILQVIFHYVHCHTYFQEIQRLNASANIIAARRVTLLPSKAPNYSCSCSCSMESARWEEAPVIMLTVKHTACWTLPCGDDTGLLWRVGQEER